MKGKYLSPSHHLAQIRRVSSQGIFSFPSQSSVARTEAPLHEMVGSVGEILFKHFLSS